MAYIYSSNFNLVMVHGKFEAIRKGGRGGGDFKILTILKGESSSNCYTNFILERRSSYQVVQV